MKYLKIWVFFFLKSFLLNLKIYNNIKYLNKNLIQITIIISEKFICDGSTDSVIWKYMKIYGKTESQIF